MIKNAYQSTKPLLSFEVFPPKKEGDFSTAFEVLKLLSKMNPGFISVTYGAGGSKARKTIEIASYIQNELSIPALTHLTCVGSTKEELLQLSEEIKKAGLTHILALRGDRPQTMTDEQFEARDFYYASQMIPFLKQQGCFEIAAACYPEKHFEAVSLDEDLIHLQEKIAAGASFLISQLFFDNEVFYRFLEKARAMGINVPISTGIMPVTSVKQLGTTVTLSGSSVPKKFSDLLSHYADKPEDMKKAGIDYAIQQIDELIRHGADGIHIYTMNKSETASQIVNALGL